MRPPKISGLKSPLPTEYSFFFLCGPPRGEGRCIFSIRGCDPERFRGYSLGSRRIMLSFVVPAYNEELELPSTLAAIHAAARGSSDPYEIIVVNDASTDATEAVAVAGGARVVTINRRQIA